MSKNLLQVSQKEVKKLSRESYRKTNNLYEEKIINFAYKNSGNFSKKFYFKGVPSIASLNINFDTLIKANVEVILNDVMLTKFSFENSICLTREVYIQSDNILQINIVSENTNFVNILTNLKTCAKNNIKNVNKILNLNSDIFFINNNILTKSNNIETLCNDINTYNNANNDIYYDINFLFQNATNIKNEINVIYYNNSLKLKNLTLDIEYGLDEQVESCCLISSNNDNKKYIIVMVVNGEILVKEFNHEMTLINEYKLTKFNGKKIIKVRSFVSDNLCTYFLAQDTSKQWYLVDLNLELSNTNFIRPYVVSDDMIGYYINNEFLFISLMDVGVKIDKFTDYQLKENNFSKKYLNVLNAFYYDGDIYLVNSDNVQIIAMD